MARKRESFVSESKSKCWKVGIPVKCRTRGASRKMPIVGISLILVLGIGFYILVVNSGFFAAEEISEEPEVVEFTDAPVETEEEPVEVESEDTSEVATIDDLEKALMAQLENEASEEPAPAAPETPKNMLSPESSLPAMVVLEKPLSKIIPDVGAVGVGIGNELEVLSFDNGFYLVRFERMEFRVAEAELSGWLAE